MEVKSFVIRLLPKAVFLGVGEKLFWDSLRNFRISEAENEHIIGICIAQSSEAFYRELEILCLHLRYRATH